MTFIVMDGMYWVAVHTRARYGPLQLAGNVVHCGGAEVGAESLRAIFLNVQCLGAAVVEEQRLCVGEEIL
jgi:hypothetical protein